MTSLRVQPRVAGNQNLVLEKLHHEAIAIHSIAANYIPRTLIAEDKVLGEDRLSEFKNAYPVDIYLENVDGFDGQNSFASKFGLQIDSSATVLISRRGWDQAVGKYGTTVLPNRPAEGDLLYIPMTKGIFEINYVDHQKPFYQLGQYYSYRMTIQLFRYSSEKINTGVAEVDIIEDQLSMDAIINGTDTDRGGDNAVFETKAASVVFSASNPFGEI